MFLIRNWCHQKDSVQATGSHGSECPLIAFNCLRSSPPVELSLSPQAGPCPRLPPAWASCLCSTLWECPSCKSIWLWWSRLEACPCLILGVVYVLGGGWSAVTSGPGLEAAHLSPSACPSSLWHLGCPLTGGMHPCFEGSRPQNIYEMRNVFRTDSSLIGGAGQVLTAAQNTEQKELV